jgi:hypothetical protein
MMDAIPPPALPGSGSRVECYPDTPLSLVPPSSPCIIRLLSEYNDTRHPCQVEDSSCEDSSRITRMKA